MAFGPLKEGSSEAKTSKGKKVVKAESQTLVGANENRVSLSVFNPSSKEVWLACGSTATKEEGIWLKKESGSIVINDYGGPVSCVTTEGEGTITFVEV
ncbi:MAG TPA: hypothetical protein VFJ76_07690 [Solirubrobacterales bacterium]|nr:hypothetical protein [Solirubrobacterales bacterium]